MKADIMLSSSAIFDGKKKLPYTGFVAIKDDLIIGIGAEKDKESYIGPDTRQYEFGDKLVMPGFHDNHNHVYLSMIFDSAVFLGGTKTEEKATKKLFEDTVQDKEVEWVLGYGWHQAKWENQKTPTKSSLDLYFPDKPVFLMHETGHAAWINTVALKKLNITKDTPNPENGIIDRDALGEPTGLLLEDAYIDVAKEAFKLTKEQENKALTNYLRQSSSYGITSVDDMFYIMGLDLGNPELYCDFEEKGKLPVRINFYKQLTKHIEELKCFEKYRTKKVNFMGVKLFLDGVASMYTAYMVDSYANKDGFYGTPFYTQKELNEIAETIDKVSYKMRIHAVGDASVRMALNACENLEKKNGKQDRRHCIEHIEIIHPHDIVRFNQIKIIPSLQPNHMAITHHLEDNPFLEFLGLEREPYFWIGKTLIESCRIVSYGTDFPISDLNPMNTVFRAVNRVMDDMKPESGWNPQEKVDIETALRCYTYNGAYSNFKENLLGTLEEGKYADIAILDRNIFKINPINLKEVKTIMTISAGNVVYD